MEESRIMSFCWPCCPEVLQPVLFPSLWKDSNVYVPPQPNIPVLRCTSAEEPVPSTRLSRPGSTLTQTCDKESGEKNMETAKQASW